MSNNRIHGKLEARKILEPYKDLSFFHEREGERETMQVETKFTNASNLKQMIRTVVSSRPFQYSKVLSRSHP